MNRRRKSILVDWLVPEVLVGLIHKGSDCCFPSRLYGGVAGDVQIGDLQSAQERLDHG